MKLLTLIIALFLPFSSLSQEKAGPPPIKVAQVENKIPEYLQNISCTIKSEGKDGMSQGSGVLFTRKDTNGDHVTYCLTAAHVIDNLRSERQVLSLDGDKKTIVEFKSPVIVKHLIEKGRVIGKTEIEATVIKWSSSEFGQDLALLQLRKKNFTADTATLSPDEIIPVGMELYHLGSRLGEFGAGQLTVGILSSIGKVLEGDKVYDISSCPGLPGSSGGGTFLKVNGEYIGMVQRKATEGETFIFIKPTRLIKEWAKDQKVEWFFNPEVPLPTDEVLKKLPVEDTRS